MVKRAWTFDASPAAIHARAQKRKKERQVGTPVKEIDLDQEERLWNEKQAAFRAENAVTRENTTGSHVLDSFRTYPLDKDGHDPLKFGQVSGRDDFDPSPYHLKTRFAWSCDNFTVWQALKTLRKNYPVMAHVLVRIEVDHMPLQAVAQDLKVSERTVRTYRTQGRFYLQGLIEGMQEQRATTSMDTREADEGAVGEDDDAYRDPED